MNTFNAPTTQINTVDKMTTVKCKTVDLQGYVIIVVQTKDNKVKLYGSPAVGRDNLEVADEIMDVNETRLEDMTRTEVIGHIHEVRCWRMSNGQVHPVVSDKTTSSKTW
ncbi:unnamed protein product [Plutella xylostella]|uniref:(diamondback moth) hypothetical protein n=1 Tax=Plutella xylostella TaxID=51655 RepID=A0A8S4G6Q4_PLUXY|nr:unnamed protein product [Plutella xylostella]